MSLGRKLFIEVNSGDFTANNASANSFTNTLAVPIILDKDKDYEVCVYDTEFVVRQDTNSVYINCDLVNQTVVGSQQTNSICRIPRSELAPALNTDFYFTTETSRKWYPLFNKKISKIQVSFTTSTGALMPVTAGDFSNVTFAYREVVY